jgi:hypothetical protein
MTGPRSARSARLLVGSTPVSVKVQSAGQTLSRFFEKPRTSLWRLPLEPLSEQHLELALERRHRALQPSAVSVLLELLPGAEQAAGYVGAPLAEFLLRGQPRRRG